MYPNRDSISGLIEMERRDRGTFTGTKYFLPICQQKVDLDQLGKGTGDWLLVDKVLKDKVAIQSYLRLNNEESENVVVKIGDSDVIGRDYLRSNILWNKGISGFARYICMLTCKDKILRYDKHVVRESSGFCTGGDDVSAIVMPFYSNSSLESYLKTTDHVDLQYVKSCMITVIVNLRNAFVNASFIHGDMTLNNILLCENGDPLIFDFGNSFIIPVEYQNKDIPFYKELHMNDIKTFVNEIETVLLWTSKPLLLKMSQLNSRISQFNGNLIPVDELLFIINNLEFKIY